jgi:hypothetical protein
VKVRSGEDRQVAARSQPHVYAPNVQRATEELARRVMGWRTAPDRFIKSNRSWIPCWRFQPFTEMASAFELLDRASDWYTITCKGGAFSVEVRAGRCAGRASGDCLARTIALAVAQTVGLEIQQ